MPFPARRVGTVLFTVSVAFASLTSMPTAGAAPHARSGASTTSWFTDPLTPAERADLVRVPTHPTRYDGMQPQVTRALYKSYDGSLAVPVQQSNGHDVVTGQAVTFDVPISFPAHALTGAAGAQLTALRASTATATRIRCEGYVRYGSSTPAKDPAGSLLRAQKMCAALSAGRTDLETHAYGYGSTRPVVIGGPVSQQHTLRAANRRVVVIVTRTAPAPSIAPAAVAVGGITVGDTTAAVTFTAPAAGTSPITGYEYSLNGGSWNTLTTSGTSPITGTLTGLTNGTAYSIRVRAVSADGNGGASEPVSGTPVAPTPVVVTPAAVVLSHSFGDASALLSFAAPEPGTSPITRYEYTLDNGTTWATLATTGSDPYSATITGLTNDTSYTIKVRAVSNDGNGTPSAPFTGTPVAPVIAPGAVQIGEFAFGDTSATVAFDAPTDGSSPITGYQYTLNNGDTWNDLDTTGASPIIGTITGLTNGTSYTIKVRAVSNDGNGTASAAVTGTPVPDSVVAEAPTLTGVAFGDATATATFTAPTVTGSDPIDGYEYSTNDGDTWHTLTTTGTAPITGTITGLTNDTSYTIRVRAVTAAGNGDPSTSITGTPTAPTPVAAPATITDLTATPGDGQATLTFAKPDDGTSPIDGYEYTYDNGTNWYPLTTTGTDPLTATISGLGNGTSYSYKVRATSPDGHGNPSNQADVTPTAAATAIPGAPLLNQSNSDVGPMGELFFSIDTPINDGGSAITGYQWSVDGGGWSDVSYYDPANPTYAYVWNGSYSDCNSHSYQLRAVNANGTSDPSNSIDLNTWWWC